MNRNLTGIVTSVIAGIGMPEYNFHSLDSEKMRVFDCESMDYFEWSISNWYLLFISIELFNKLRNDMKTLNLEAIKLKKKIRNWLKNTPN